MLQDEPAPCPENEGGPWVVQLLRSITIDSATIDEVTICLKQCSVNMLHLPIEDDNLSFLQERANEIHMFKKYGRLIDNSIMRQYVNLIRNAVSFIYLENQYFIGSAYSWLDDQKTLAPHTIPR